MGRAPCCEKVGLRKGKWTAEEDEKLLNYITANGEGSWRSLPKNAGLLRCGKSCRLRWINYLRADLKRGNITREEEEVMIKLHSSLGNRWSVIASHLPGRTDNEIKNYWNSHLRRRVHRFRKMGSEDEVITMVLDKVPGPGRRKRRTSQKSSSTEKVVEVHEKSADKEVTRNSTTFADTVDPDLWPSEDLLSPDPLPPLTPEALSAAGREGSVGPQKQEEASPSTSSSSPWSFEQQEQVEQLWDWDTEEGWWSWLMDDEEDTLNATHDDGSEENTWLLSDTILFSQGFSNE